MAYLDITMAWHYFKEVNKREPMVTELPKLRSLTQTTPQMVSKNDYIKAWTEINDALLHPEVAEKDVDWAQLSRWSR